ncbi:2,3-bisphosphoglycerate-independent phosphoglycerate mutase 1 [Cardamine amara subsp. amara]|uniref:2,3-bisphosphoglycerate-independent phosphoglycerate mutase 1 n=1 Tax=Cardamine amara subsp. amara TaxID=228776 RepID=A0ABD1BC86_CARAN
MSISWQKRYSRSLRKDGLSDSSGYFNKTLEQYHEIPSDSDMGICELARNAILSGEFYHVRVHIPNGDMAGDFVACKAAANVIVFL